MAIWQVDFSIVKKSNISLKIDNIDDLISWNNDEINLMSLDSLKMVFKYKVDKNGKYDIFGSYEETIIKIFHYSEMGCEISVRIDVRSINRTQMTAILSFIHMNNAVILYDSTFFEPTKDNLLKIISESRAMKFFSDPHKFFDELDEGELDKSFLSKNN